MKFKALQLNMLMVIATIVALPSYVISQPLNVSFNRAAKIINHGPDKVIVKFRPGAVTQAPGKIHGTILVANQVDVHAVDGMKVFTLAPGQDLASALDHYKKNPNIEYVEPDFILTLSATNDTNFGNLWGLENTGQTLNGTTGTSDADMNIPEAWTGSGVTGSNGVVIAVIDSGVQYTHPDLAANMWVNPGEIAGNGVDDDGNGYIDDIYGINAITNTGNPMDDNMHGTHVAGTIAAVGNNSAGITGVVQQAKILACKFTNSSGSGSTSDAIKCLDYIYALKQRGINIVVSNNSWGGPGGSQALSDAIDAQRRAGIVFVAAAGNDGTDNDATPQYPANYFVPNIISVAATTQNDTLASFSDYGRQTVHVGAPGVNIYSTVPTNSFTYLQGTSMAAPHVTGLVALLSAQDSSRDWKTLKNLVVSSGTPIAALNNKSISGRRVRAWDTNGTGALSCSTQTVSAVVYPQAGAVTKISGTKLGLAALNINCAIGAGTMTVSTSGPAAVGTITLQDDGLGFDQVSGDGTYSGYWTAPATTGTYTLTFSNNQTVSVTVIANTSTRKPYRAPIPTTFNWRTGGAGYSPLADNYVSSIGGWTGTFNINFGGVATDPFYATPKGTVMTSDPTATPSRQTGVNTTLPNDVFETLVAAYWDDLDLTGSGDGLDAWGQFNGTTGEVVFAWKGKHKTSGNPVEIQLVFPANSSNIEMQYKTTDGSAATATVGVQVNQVEGTIQSVDTATSDLSNGKAWLWLLDANIPVAHAGSAQNVSGNALVSLDGSLSSDTDGGTLRYSWTQTAGTAVALSNANSVNPSFYAPNLTGTLTFQLTVYDDGNLANTNTNTNTVNINVTAVASAGSLQFGSATYSINENGGNASISVTRTGGSAGAVDLTFATTDGSAAAGSDFTYTSGTLSWADGDTATKTVTIPIVDDIDIEANETLSILLSNPTGGATLGVSTATLTINDNDSAGVISFATSTYSVAENGVNVTITAMRTGGISGAVSANFATTDGTAMAGSDYSSTNGTLSWAHGDSANKSFTLSITDDSVYESDETVNLTLSNAIGGATLGTSSAILTITNDDAAPPGGAIAWSAPSYTIAENAGSVTVTVTRSGGSTGAVGVSYVTSNGTATAGSDFSSTSGTLTWSDGDNTDKTFTISITDDTNYEGDETFNVTLSNVTGSAALLTADATVTIVENDAVNHAPGAPELLSPADTATGVDATNVTFKWNGVTDSDGDAVSYELYYCDNNAFTGCTPVAVAKADVKGLVLAGVGGSGVAIIGLVGGLIRRQRWILTALALAMVLLSSACGSNLPPGSGTPATSTKSQTVSGLAPATTYYWKVVATDNKGASNTSAVRSFTTK